MLDLGLVLALGTVVALVLLAVLLFHQSWRVAEPDEALIISGFRSTKAPDGAGETMGFRIVTGPAVPAIRASTRSGRSRSRRTRARSPSRA